MTSWPAIAGSITVSYTNGTLIQNQGWDLLPSSILIEIITNNGTKIVKPGYAPGFSFVTHAFGETVNVTIGPMVCFVPFNFPPWPNIVPYRN
ncbi:MAG: hypothetical protein ACP5NQ_09685, partial [Vulcanisaeta sp.]